MRLKKPEGWVHVGSFKPQARVFTYHKGTGDPWTVLILERAWPALRKTRALCPKQQLPWVFCGHTWLGEEFIHK